MADITYVATWSGFAYAALVIDVFARRSDGRLPPRPSTSYYGRPDEAVLRRPLEPKQYLSVVYTERLAEEKAVASVGSRGDSYDCEHDARRRSAGV